jgi:hypothetical protein
MRLQEGKAEYVFDFFNMQKKSMMFAMSSSQPISSSKRSAYSTSPLGNGLASNHSSSIRLISPFFLFPLTKKTLSP